jgi:hypothetical protein
MKKKTGAITAPSNINFPLNCIRPSEAIINAPIKDPAPLAEKRRPFVVAFPPSTVTAHAGISVANERANMLFTATIPIRTLTIGWVTT